MIKQYDVICPHCCGCFHETNEHFKADAPAKGHMFAAKRHVTDAGWTCFPPYDSTEYMDLVCPSCGQPYVDSVGRVIRLQEVGEIEEADSKPTIQPQYATVQPQPLFVPAEHQRRRGRKPKGA